MNIEKLTYPSKHYYHFGDSLLSACSDVELNEWVAQCIDRISTIVSEYPDQPSYHTSTACGEGLVIVNAYRKEKDSELFTITAFVIRGYEESTEYNVKL